MSADGPKHIDLSIVVPCYNEEQNIPLIVRRFKDAVARADSPVNIEIILVNNGSTDHSAAIMQSEIEQSGTGIFIIETVPVNKGYGFGILSGLRRASGSLLAWTHADMQTDPFDVIKAYNFYKSEAVRNPKLIVKGRRVGRRFGEWAFTMGMSIISSCALSSALFDINAQPKLFPKVFFDSLRNPPHDFSLDLFLIYAAKKSGYLVKTIDVTFKKRLFGESKWAFSWKSKYKTILRTVRYIFQLKNQLSRDPGAYPK